MSYEVGHYINFGATSETTQAPSRLFDIGTHIVFVKSVDGDPLRVQVGAR